MATSYTGPTVSPVFVAGVINDAFDAATSLTARARASVGGLNPQPISPDSLAPIEAPDDMTVTLPAWPDDITDEAGLEGQLTNALSSWMATYYPASAMPDAAAAWLRVADSFDGQHLGTAIAQERARLADSWAARGFDLPAAAAAALDAEMAATASRIAANSTRSRDILYTTHRKAIDLTGYSLVMRTHLEAMEAARAFLIGAVEAVANRQADMAATIAGLQDGVADAFWRHLNARIEANATELDRLVLARRIEVDADAAEKDRRTFVFRQEVGAAVDELQSLASQAAAALNRVHASAAVRGRESTP